jgi:hypothetical protein
VHKEAKAVLANPPRDDVMVLDMLGKRSELERGPQALWVWHPPKWVIDPHFHLSDQFQVVVQGDAKIGKKGMPLGTVQYMDGFTPYGPIVCGDEGMTFVFLRAHSDIGAYYMPGAKEAMKRRAGRSVAPVMQFYGGDVAPGCTLTRTLIESQADGLAGHEVLAAPGVSLPLNRVALGAGCFQLIIRGSLRSVDKELPPDSCTFTPPGELFPARTAGKEGVHLLELQLPTS